MGRRGGNAEERCKGVVGRTDVYTPSEVEDYERLHQDPWYLPFWITWFVRNRVPSSDQVITT